MSEDELMAQLDVLESSNQKLKFEQAVRGLADTSQFAKIRKDIARINTELTKRDLAEASEEDLEGRSRIRARRARQKKAH